MSGKVLKGLIVIFVLLFGIVQISLNNAQAYYAPVTAISFNEGESFQEVDVHPDGDCKAIFNGTIIITPNPDSSVTPTNVSFRSSTDMGWPSIVTPETMKVNIGEPMPFSVEVNVTPYTNAGVIGKLTVGATVETSPGGLRYWIDPIVGYIKIKPYYRLHIMCDDPIAFSSPGAQEDFSVVIANEGNSDDTYSLEIINLKELENKGFTAHLTRTKLEVPERQEAEIGVVVTVPDDSRCMGGHDIIIQARSESNVTENITDQMTLFIRVRDNNIIYTTDYCLTISISSVIVITLMVLLWRRRRRNKKTKNKIE